jgi:crossover junction endodeoxyribonuclease RuvC
MRLLVDHRTLATSVCALGIDPGSRFTGYGVVVSTGGRFRHLGSGVIRVPTSITFPERLGFIHREVLAIIAEFRPESMAIEDVFIAANVKSAMKLGQARGAAIVAGVNAGLDVHEYSALQIKQAVVGYGRAAKEQVTKMMQTLLLLPGPMNPNAADALAVALCHLNTHAFRMRCLRSAES